MDMLRIFNCGVGMTVTIDHKDLGETQNIIQKHNLKSFLIGKVLDNSSDKINFI